jgi:putative two-component system response regulator
MNEKKNVLIIENDNSIRNSIREALSIDYICSVSSDASKAANIISSKNPELVIFDSGLPGSPCLELLPELHKLHPDTAILVTVTAGDMDTVTFCLQNGATDYIEKPIDVSDIPNRVYQALVKKNLELQLRENQRELEYKLEQEKRKIRLSYLKSIERLISALEDNDKYTQGHSRRVAAISTVIARELKLGRADVEDIHWAGLLHDVGKLAIDQSIRNKPSRLTQEEYCYVMSHAVISLGIVKPLVNRRIEEIIFHHHDRYDGSGLDQKVSGEDIPVGARIIALADAWDAMLSQRAYRPAMSKDQAIAEIVANDGIQFDPMLVDILFKLLDKKAI